MTGRISLANIPTPIHKMNFNGCSFLMKRDDFTGLELSGNKVRKLEYLLYDAKKQGAHTVFTCGGDQSNHSRATAIAAAAAGFKCKLFLWGKDSSNPEGNLFLDKFVNAETEFLTRKEYDNVYELMYRERDERALKGEKVYVIPAGGSSEVGILGYVRIFDELKNQVNMKQVKGILTACGSGGTSAGLLVGSAVNNFNIKVFAVNVLDTPEQMRNEILSLAESCIRRFRLKAKVDESRLEVLGGYSEEGYKHIAPEKLSVIKEFALQTGVVLDPAYTGKAWFAYNELFLRGKPSAKVMFIHTGGLFGVFNKRKEYLSV